MPSKRTSLGYEDRHAKAGISARLPALETWPSQYPGTEITIQGLEFTSICPKTGLPDYGTLVIRYEPARHCLELKSLKLYLVAYRNLGIFYENVVNKVLRDVVKAAKPKWCVVRGEFSNRGGLTATVEARWPRKIR